MRHKKKIIAWFVVFGGLSATMLSPAFPMVILVTGILTGGILTIVFIAAPTILLYSAMLLPALLLKSRPVQPPRWQLAAALVLPFAVALLPGLVSRSESWLFEQRISHGDFAKEASEQPKTVELAGDGESGLLTETAGSNFRVSCGEVCRRLLFNREAERVRITRLPMRSLFFRDGPPLSVTYRIEKRDSCPEAYPAGSILDQATRTRLVAGECVIADNKNGEAMDAILTFETMHRWDHFPIPPDQAPVATEVKMVRRLSASQRQPDGTTLRVRQQTETQSETLSLPFYFGAEFHIQGSRRSGLTIARQSRIAQPIEFAQAARDTFGFKLAPVAPLPPDDAQVVAQRILLLPTESAPIFSAQQQDVLNDALFPLKRQDKLSDTDIDLIGRIVRDTRVTDRVGLTLAELFHKHATQLEPIIPLVIERLKVPVPERIGHYQSSLGWSLTSYPADMLQPYRDTIIAIIEAQPDWPTNGLLARMGELTGDPSDLIARRLQSKSYTVRQAAAAAICRATPANWETLKPIALAHLRNNVGPRRVRDEDPALLAALMRFGEKATVDTFIDALDIYGKRSVNRLVLLEAGFPASKCKMSW